MLPFSTLVLAGVNMAAESCFGTPSGFRWGPKPSTEISRVSQNCWVAPLPKEVEADRELSGRRCLFPPGLPARAAAAADEGTPHFLPTRRERERSGWRSRGGCGPFNLHSCSSFKAALRQLGPKALGWPELRKEREQLVAKKWPGQVLRLLPACLKASS